MTDPVKLPEARECMTPLLDLLDAVPLDARMTYEHSPIEHSMISVGRHCRAAAERIRELERLEASWHSIADDRCKRIHELESQQPSGEAGWQASALRGRIQELEVERKSLRQTLWDCYGACGADTDGDTTPDALVGDLGALVLNAVREARKDYDDALDSIAKLEAERDEARESAKGWQEQMARDLDKLLEVARERDEARRDAERYRWLRAQPEECDPGNFDVCRWDDAGGWALRKEDLDGAIDAAMAGKEA